MLKLLSTSAAIGTRKRLRFVVHSAREDLPKRSVVTAVGPLHRIQVAVSLPLQNDDRRTADAAQYEVEQEAARSAVAVEKGMDALELVVDPIGELNLLEEQLVDRPDRRHGQSVHPTDLMARGRPARATVYARLDAALIELRELISATAYPIDLINSAISKDLHRADVLGQAYSSAR